MLRQALICLALVAGFVSPSLAEESRPVHGLSLFGDLKYPASFKHFDYVNPAAPKGGQLRLSNTGGFDNLNPFIPKGRALAYLQTLVYDTLTKPSLDEPSTAYGLIAKEITVAPDRSWVIFTLRPEARFQDGSPIRAEDVVFSFETLRDKAAPFYRFYYRNVAKAEVLGPSSVKFSFDKAGNRELPQIMGELPILPKHYWKNRDFAATTLEPPLGSGPYRVTKVAVNQQITFERVRDYWGASLPVNLGMDNFDRITVINFNDREVELQGLFADSFDFRLENSAKNWATRYDNAPAVKSGAIKRDKPVLKQAEPMQAFVVNLRKTKFSDPRVRLALDYALDFEWANTHLFFGQYARTTSFFQNSELAATGLPSGLELNLLEPFRAQLPKELFDTVYSEPKTDGSGNDRSNLRIAQNLLMQAGWIIKNGVLTNAGTGEVMRIEYLDRDETFEKMILSYKERLARLGIALTYRVVDDSQYINRLRKFDFDMITHGIQQSLSPGNEQREYWSSAAADRPESRNVIGIKNPVIDALIDKIIFAEDRAHLVAASRALDRVLLWNHFVIPAWHAPYERVAYWDRLGKPAQMPQYALGFPEIWWFDAARAAKLGSIKN